MAVLSVENPYRCLLALLGATTALAQGSTSSDGDGRLDDVFEERPARTDGLLSGFGDWAYWQQNPINPCQASKEVLAELPALNIDDAEELWRQAQNARGQCSVKYLIHSSSLPTSTIKALIPLLRDGAATSDARWSRMRLSTALASRMAVEPPMLLRAETHGPRQISAAATFSWHRFTLQKVAYSLRDDALKAAPARHDVGPERLHLQLPLGPLLVGVGDFSLRLAEGLVISTSRATGDDSLSADPGVVEALGTSARCVTDHQLPVSSGCTDSTTELADFELRPSLRGLFLSLPPAPGRAWSALIFGSNQSADVKLNHLLEGRTCRFDELNCRAPLFFIGPSSALGTSVGPSATLPAMLVESLVGLRMVYQVIDWFRIGATATVSHVALKETPLELRLSKAVSHMSLGVSTVAAVDFHAVRGHWSSAAEAALSVDWQESRPEPQLAASARLARKAEHLSIEFEAWHLAAGYRSQHAHPRLFSAGVRTSSWQNHRGARVRFALARPEGVRFSTHLAVSEPLVSLPQITSSAAAASGGFQWLLHYSQVFEPSLSASVSVPGRQLAECADLDALNEDGCGSSRLQVTPRLAVNPVFARWLRLQLEARLSTRLGPGVLSAGTLATLSSHVELSLGRHVELTLSARCRQPLENDFTGQSWNLASRLNVRPGAGFQLGLHYRSGPLFEADDGDALKHRIVLNVEWKF